jgi:hypothetical protein
MPSGDEETSRREQRRVTRAIKLAVALIAEHDPGLAELLRKTIKTGRFLSYSPEPGSAAMRKSAPAKATPPLPCKDGIPPRTR